MRPFFLFNDILNIAFNLSESMRIIFAVITGVLLFSCDQKPDHRFERLDATVTGIDFVNEIIEKDSFNILHNEYMYNGGGVGIGDLNNDTLPDIVFTANKIRSRIYLNKGGFKFQDITDRFKGMVAGQWMSGVVVVDVNADGWKDVYMTSTMNDDPEMRRNQFWLNEGLASDGLPTFREAAAEFGIDDRGHSMHAAFLDYDLDGDLDLYVLNNVISKEVPTNYRPKLRDGSSPNNDAFYENLGNGKFQNITLKAGITIEGYGLGIAVADFNKDLYPDLYISNDYISNDILYLNQRNGTFKDQSEVYLSHQSRFSMGNDAADVNNDGNPEIITMDMMPEDYFRKKQTINGNSYYVYYNNQKYGYQNQYIRNMFQVHNGFLDSVMLPFSEQAQMSGVYQTEWSWSPLFADYDNDGDKDLLVTNGFPMDLTDKDFTNYKAEYFGSLITEEELLARIPIVKVSNYAFENKGDLKFENVTESWGMKIPSFSNGASFVDLDLDGDLDYVVNNIDDPAFVYHNMTNEQENASHNWLRIDVRGVGANPDAIGAYAEIWSAGNYQFLEKNLSRGYISSVDPILHFGLGNLQKVDSVRIVWPWTKQELVVKDPKINQVLRVTPAKAVGLKRVKTTSVSAPIFNKRDDVFNYVHTETDYVDFFQGQAVMQHKYSMIGPVMDAGDIDGDGMDEILVGGGFGHPATAFRFEKGKYISMIIPGWSGDRNVQTSDLLLADMDNDKDADIIEIAGGYSQEDIGIYKHALYRNQDGRFVKEELPVPAFIGSVVRSEDVDRDGDLDLFIGQRVKRKNFPYSGPSWILINNGSDFKPMPFDLEMVTDAAFTDLDGDGWKDLIVTRELNTITWLKNESGKSFRIMEKQEWAELHGFWESVTVADLDQNGSDDLIFGNLGDNHRFTVSEQYPFRVYGVDVDKNGVADPVCTSYWKDKSGIMTEYPVNYMDELFAQSPYFRKLFTSYTTFSYTPMNQIYENDTIGQQRIRYSNFTSSVMFWNDKGKLTRQDLPGTLQSTPLKKTLVNDFTGDGNVDILIGGNDHSFDVSTGNYDAGRGMLLTSGENKQLTVLHPSQTGLRIMGQVNSLMMTMGEKPLIIVGINRRVVQVYSPKSSLK